ncbi:hypothetical protein [Sinorhizobium fredii]|nr:hypothetical protein [Sinorhizobium fredii]
MESWIKASEPEITLPFPLTVGNAETSATKVGDEPLLAALA